MDILSVVKMGLLISPNEYVDRVDIKNPLIFLAGPIRSAPEWHEFAIEYLFSKEKEITIASPNRIDGKVIKSKEFSRQREWERYYLKTARKEGEKGCVMFWLPKEKKNDCGKVYGAMSRFELGQLFTYFELDNSTRFCIGSDGDFQELNTMEDDLEYSAPDKKIFKTLEETCDEALKIALN